VAEIAHPPMAVVTGNTISNSVAGVVIAKWSGSFGAQVVAERHLYPERYSAAAADDTALADTNRLSGDRNDAPYVADRE